MRVFICDIIKLMEMYLMIEAYEKINEITINNLLYNTDILIDKKLIDDINQEGVIYDKEKIEDLDKYYINPNIKDYEYLINKYKKNIVILKQDELIKLYNYIAENIKYYKVNKKQFININLDDMLNKNELYQKYKDKIIMHLDVKIKGYRTIYLPIKNECHIFGNYGDTLKDLIFIFHELGHSFQLVSTSKIHFDYTIAEIYACINEILMSKSTNYFDDTIKLINNKILESICTFDFYNYLYNLEEFNVNKIELEWENIHNKYGVPFKSMKWLTDFNSMLNPQNIISYTIAYIISLNYIKKSYKDFKNICKSNITLDEIINLSS